MRFFRTGTVLAIFSLFIIYYSSFIIPASAGELEDIEKKLSDLSRMLEMSRNATAPLEKSLSTLKKELEGLRLRINNLEAEVIKKEKEVKEGEQLLADYEEILTKRIRSFYKNSAQTAFSSLAILGGKNLREIVRNSSYHQAVIEEDKKTIIQIVLYIKNLEEKKAQLEQEKIRLAAVKEETDKQAAFLDKEIKSAKAYQAILEGEIAKLTARQQQLLAEKLAGLNLPTSLGAGPLYCTDDRKLDPGFSPAFAFYTYGIPHRVGMNQYGAYGRARAGQSYQDILRAYFDGISFEKKPNINIKVQGYGEMPLEQYMLGIYEMPDSWMDNGLAALKAQAVAARSYALAYTNNGKKEICTSQACQVYKGGNKGGNWEQAVKATEGEVMVRDGQVITAWYASTAGGYTFTSADVGWSSRSWTKRLRDTSGDINSFSDLQERAYDKDSPCFYAAQGWRSQHGKSAWLKPEEVADIVNVILLARQDSSTREHLYQTDKPHPYGGEIWNEDRVKQELRSRGINPFNSVNGISVDWDKGVGRTTSINISGDAGSQSFDGSEFKDFFNLRAPANIQIVGPLFNVERR